MVGKSATSWPSTKVGLEELIEVTLNVWVQSVSGCDVVGVQLVVIVSLQFMK